LTGNAEGGEAVHHRVHVCRVVLVDKGEEALDGEAVTHGDGNQRCNFRRVLHGGGICKPRDGA
jgi:hypothetical protein